MSFSGYPLGVSILISSHGDHSLLALTSLGWLPYDCRGSYFFWEKENGSMSQRPEETPTLKTERDILLSG